MRAPGHNFGAFQEIGAPATAIRRMARDQKPDDEAAMRARLDALGRELRARRPPPAAAKSDDPATKDEGFGSAMSLALRAGSEFVAAIVVGGLIGYGLDALMHTKPAFLIVFFLVGGAAGTVNVIRATSPKGAAEHPTSRLPEAKGEDKHVPRSSPRGGEVNGE